MKKIILIIKILNGFQPIFTVILFNKKLTYMQYVRVNMYKIRLLDSYDQDIPCLYI